MFIMTQMPVSPDPSEHKRAQKAYEIQSLLRGGILSELLYFGVRTLSIIIRTLSIIIPKSDNQVLFASIPDYSDNAKALSEYIATNQVHQQYDIVWLVNDSDVLQKLTQNGIQAYPEKSVRGLYSILRSKYIIGTHSHYCWFKAKNQCLVNLWHGMPLKAMGYTDGLEKGAALKIVKLGANTTDMLIATSAITKTVMATSFFIDPRKVVVTGQPRNDYLFATDEKRKLAMLLDRDLSKYDKLLLYMPTFRVGYGRVEGATAHLDFLRTDLFNKFLIDNNILFVLKLHPFEEKYWLSQDDFKQNNGNIVILKTDCLTNHLISIHEVLADFDILITDYSSIFFDFLLLNRPIIFWSLDLEEYAQTRGFSLEPYDFWTPGPKAMTVEMLIDEIQRCISDPTYYEKERITVNDLINQFQDENSCERVWKEILHMAEGPRKR